VPSRANPVPISVLLRDSCPIRPPHEIGAGSDENRSGETRPGLAALHQC
jgi:hypothetical protein